MPVIHARLIPYFCPAPVYRAYSVKSFPHVWIRGSDSTINVKYKIGELALRTLMYGVTAIELGPLLYHRVPVPQMQ